MQVIKNWVITSIFFVFVALSAALTVQADDSAYAFGVEPIMVNINTANAEILAEELNGIGLKKAQKIIQYRNEVGRFDSIDELINVKGIGPKFLEINRDLLTTE